jgi:hypothetical protein
MKIALVHDYLKEMGGAEVVLIALKEMFPEATVYTAYKFPKYWGWAEQIMNNWDIKESFGKYLPGLPILGAVNPQFFNNHLFEAHSFSGRGLMQSYEAGRILSSMILNLKEYDPQFEKLSSARFYSSQGDSGFTEMMII